LFGSLGKLSKSQSLPVHFATALSKVAILPIKFAIGVELKEGVNFDDDVGDG